MFQIRLMVDAEAVFRDTIKVSESLGNTNYIIYSDEKTDPISYIYSFKNYKRIKKSLITNQI